MYWRYAKRVFTVVALLLIVGASGLAIVTKLNGGELLSVQTSSMVPTFRRGTLVSVTRVPASQLAVGDIITFIDPYDSHITLTHRLVQTPSANNDYKFVTKGDANKVPDTPIRSSAIIGKEQFAIPYAGNVVNFLRQPEGLTLIIYIPALAIVAEELRRLSAHYRSQEPYIEFGYIPRKDRQVSNHHRLATAATATVIMVFGMGLFALPAQAALRATATLTDITIKTAVISKPPQCSGSNNTSINVNSSSTQSSSTGNTTSSGNTTGGSATSGNASNSNSTSTTISVSNC
jgi:signal peptidase